MRLRGPAFALCAISFVVVGSYLATDSSINGARSRAALVSTTACGDASATAGAAVLVGGDSVLVAAHVVIGSTELTVSFDGGDHPAQLTRLDARTDLALLRVPGLRSGSVQLAPAMEGSNVTIIGAGPSGVFAATVVRLVEIRIEEVRSMVRSSRLGFEIDERVALGDSGAGVFDNDGRLVGVVFGRSTTNADRSFAVRAEEIEVLLAGDDLIYRCNPTEHRVEVALAG